MSRLMSFKLELVVCMSSPYLMIFIEAGTKYVYVFMFLCSAVLPLFSFFRVLQDRDWWTSACRCSAGSLYIRHGLFPVISSVLPSQRCGIFWLYFSMFSCAKIVLKTNVPTSHTISDFNALINYANPQRLQLQSIFIIISALDHRPLSTPIISTWGLQALSNHGPKQGYPLIIWVC